MINYKKLITANRQAKSRLHDEKGNFVGWSKAIHHGSLAIITGIARILFNYRPALPWIAYDAIKIFNETLNSQSHVLEFGSGMSTIWYARRSGTVTSIEDYNPWFLKVKGLIQELGLSNVVYIFANDITSYTKFEKRNGGYDLIIIDGSHRDRCAAEAINIIRPGGAIYLDNSDRSGAPNQQSMVVAETILREFAKRAGAEVTEITDFAPTQMFVNQGLLIQLPR